MADAAELQSMTSDLTVEAFETFVEDIGTMFDTEVSAQQVDVETGTTADLKDAYKKLAAVCSVKAQGVLDGNFHIVFDRDGLFTLAGTFVMQPEQIILQNRKSGTEQEAAEVGDALGEVGNLLVGAWDRVFREGMRGHGHFVQSGTFCGNPWIDPAGNLGISPDESLDILTFEVTVEPLPPFRCAALYPSRLFDRTQQPQTEPSESAEQEQASQAVDGVTDSQDAAGSQEEQTAAEPSENDSDPAEAAVDEASAEPDPDSEPAGSDGPADQVVEDESLESEPIQPEPIEMGAGPVSEAIRRMTGGGQSPVPPSGVPADAHMIHELCAADVMRKGVPWASPEDSIEDLIGRMQQFDSGYVLIGTDGRLEGIVSKSDVRGALSPYLQSMFVKWRTPMDIATLQIKAKWAMNRPVRTVRPDATLASIMHGMIEHGGRCMPVMDEQGKVQGIVTVFDIFHGLLSGAAGARSAGHIPSAAPIV